MLRRGDVEFDNVTFFYPSRGDQSADSAKKEKEARLLRSETNSQNGNGIRAPGDPTLKKVSFVIPGGKTCAVVGPSGSGKRDQINLRFPNRETLKLSEVLVFSWKKECFFFLEFCIEKFLFRQNDSFASSLSFLRSTRGSGSNRWSGRKKTSQRRKNNFLEFFSKK